MQAGPTLSVRPARGQARATVLLLPGGRAEGLIPVRPWQLSQLRMLPIARGLHRRFGSRGVSVVTLRYRVRGWNGAQSSPVRDARWALAELADRDGPMPVVLVGHSMGGRAAVRVADDPTVVAILGLAPWLPTDEPRIRLGGRRLLVVHGTADRWTDPVASRAYVEAVAAAGGSAAWVAVPGAGHFMLRRRRRWRELAHRFIADTLTRGSDSQSARPGGAAATSGGQTGVAPAPNLGGQDSERG